MSRDRRRARRVGVVLSVALVAGAALLTGVVAVVTSRVQLAQGGPGILAVTVPVPAALLLAVSIAAGFTSRSFGRGLAIGLAALAACCVAVAGVAAVEGVVWMTERGIWVLDADPPRQPVGTLDVALDLFTTGLWVGHLAVWLPWPPLGAALGARLARGTRPAHHAD